MTFTREVGDATNDPAFLELKDESKPVVWRNYETGEVIEGEPEKVLTPTVNPFSGAPGQRFQHVRTPPALTPEEMIQSAQTLLNTIKDTELTNPELISAIQRNPTSALMLPELQLIVDPTGDAGTVAADLMEGLMENPVAPQVLADFQKDLTSNPTQKTFWADIASVYTPEVRDVMLHLFASLSEQGAENTAALAMAWADAHGLDTDEKMTRLLTNMWQWSYDTQQTELGKTGFFAPFEFLQDRAEELFLDPIVDQATKWIAGPEEAARREGLTAGQKIAYRMGVKPPEQAGEFGWWRLTSGGIDGISEVVVDPLNVLAGLGAASKAIKIIPIATDASRIVRLGRSIRAALLPKRLSGVSSVVPGGRTARTLYAFRSKTMDDLLDGMLKVTANGKSVVGDIRNLIQTGDIARLDRLYPQFRNMGKNIIGAIENSVDDVEALEVLKHGAYLNDALINPDALPDARKAAKAAFNRIAISGEDGKKVINPDAPSDLLRDYFLKQAKADSLNKPHEAFLISQVPHRIAKDRISERIMNASWVAGARKPQRAIRRFVAASTAPVPDAIDLRRGRTGAQQLRQAAIHFGMTPAKADDLAAEFMRLDAGDRWQWMIDKGLPEIGDATGIAPLKYNLVEFFRRQSGRVFSSSGVDEYTDPITKEIHSIPMIPSQQTNMFPIPVGAIDQVARRHRAASRATRFRVRGWGETERRRRNIVQRFRQQLAENGRLPDGATDDELWRMAYAHVDQVGYDGRGWIAGQLAPRAGSVWNTIHRTFTGSMLLLRPWQWLWRVGILEEPLRAAIFNMPSVYRNPLTYMADAKDAHYLSRLTKWADQNSRWAREASSALLDNVNSLEDGIDLLKTRGMFDDIFGDKVPTNLDQLRAGVRKFIYGSVGDRTSLARLDPVKRASWRVKHRTKKIEKAKDILTNELGLAEDFSLVDDLPDMQQRLFNVYFGGAMKDGSAMPVSWSETANSAHLREYGRVYGAKLLQMIEDPMGKIALRRLAAKRAGVDLDGTVKAGKIVKMRDWPMMRSALVKKYPDLLDDDIALANRYMDEMLEVEVASLFDSLVGHLDPSEQARVLSELANNRKLDLELNGQKYDIDLSAKNVGKGVRDLAELVADQGAHSATTKFPREIWPGGFDPRFMAADPKLGFNIADKMFAFFGEGATQVLNRRPAWVAETKRWKTIYERAGLSPEVAGELAKEQAVKMVNYVFYNMDEAPALVSKLNRVVPFFGATYEVMSTWAYKMPAHLGGASIDEGVQLGHWAIGAGEFVRRIQRLMDGLVSVGLVTRVEEDDGSVSHTMASTTTHNELGNALKGVAFAAADGLEKIPAVLLGWEEAAGLREEKRLTIGNPLDPQDYGVLSFAQANIGLNPVPNLVVSEIGSRFFHASDYKRATVTEGQTLADLAEQFDADPIDIARLNRDLLYSDSVLGEEGYNRFLAGQITADEIVLEAGTAYKNPDSGWWEIVEDILQPFGGTEDPSELLGAFFPGVTKWFLMGLGMANLPQDKFWQGDFDRGMVNVFLTDANRSQMAAGATEAALYIETHDIVDGLGPFARIQKMNEQLVEMEERRDLGAEALRDQIAEEEEAYLERIQQVAYQSFMLRSLTGSFMPSSPGHVRQEQEVLNTFWGTREYADSLQIGEVGLKNLQPFKTPEEIEGFFENLVAWMQDGTGDDAKGQFARKNGEIFAYLTPKTFYKGGGIPPQITSYEEYDRQLRSGEREVAPLEVTMARMQSSHIQADYYNRYIDTFGSDPTAAAADALTNFNLYQELQEEKSLAYQALDMKDDMNGGLYDKWKREQFGSDNWTLENYIEADRDLQASLSFILEQEEMLDSAYEFDEIRDLRTGIKGTLAAISDHIDKLEALTEDDESFHNPYEEVMNNWWKQVYEPYQEQIGALYDKMREDVRDSEHRSLLYEQIKLVKNEWANSSVYLNGDTTVPFPTPQQVQWARRSDEEKRVKINQVLTRPLEWIDLEAVNWVTSQSPQMAEYLPSSQADMDIYRDWTLRKIEVEELYESTLITTSEKTDMLNQLEARVKQQLLDEGRGAEVFFMGLKPVEQIELAGLLPASVGIYMPQVRWYNEVFDNNEDLSPGSEKGRELIWPLIREVTEATVRNSQLRSDLDWIGENLYDSLDYDDFLVQFFFDNRQER